MTTYRIESRPTFRNLQGRWGKATESLIATRRRELQAEGRYLTRALKMGIREKVGQPSKIEGGVKYTTKLVGDRIQLDVKVPGRARPHRIRARNASALAFNWPKAGFFTFVPKRGGFRTHVRNGQLWIGKGHVDHPGGSLEPLVNPILKRVAGDWRRGRGRATLRRISSRFATEFKG